MVLETGSRSRSASRNRGRSRSRSADAKARSRSRSRSRSSGNGLTTIKVTDADAAFVKGKNGATKDRIAKVADCKIEINQSNLTVEIRGSAKCRARGKKYINFVITQRSGPVYVNKEDDDDDLTTILIPQKAVGFVTGKQGNFLRSIEDEWNTLMFFIDVDRSRDREKSHEKLAIWGELRGRRAAELKALNAAEYMCPGTFKDIREEVISRGRGGGECGTWDTDVMEYDDNKLSYALGKQGSTRKKIEVASGCIVQYVGNVGLYSGTAAQRKRATDYMKFLFGQLEGPIYVDGWEDRDDCRVVRVPTDIIPYVTGPKRAALSSVEDKFGAFMLFMNKDGKLRDANRESEQLIIFGSERARRGAELKVLHEIEWKKPGSLTKKLREFTSDKEGFDVDVFEVDERDINYLIGKKGSTQNKIETAVGCFLIYVGNFAHIGGDMSERKRCREYLNWLLKQLKGPVVVKDVKRRDDCTEVWVPKGLTGRVMGAGGAELRRIEQETGVFSFMAVDENGDERLCVFGKDPGSHKSGKGRMAAERMLQESIAGFQREANRRGDSRDRGRGRGRSDSRSPSPPRQRARSDSRRGYRERTPPRRAPARRDDSRPPPRGRVANRREDSRGRGGGGGGGGGGRGARDDSRDRNAGGGRDDSRGRGGNDRYRR